MPPSTPRARIVASGQRNSAARNASGGSAEEQRPARPQRSATVFHASIQRSRFASISAGGTLRGASGTTA